jgi:O-antigen/teichoic acid export membrane protein
LSNIRVTYSGLIAVTAGLISVLTGAIFTLIVTRRLSPEEFGIWAIIGSMISYFLIAEPIISFWTTRQIARNEMIGKTSLLSSTLFSVGSIPIYIILSFYVSQIGHFQYNTMILAALLLPVSFISQTISSVNLGHKPHASSYGLLVFESLKIPAGLLFVYLLDLGVDGAILTTFIAFVAKIIVQIYFARNHLSEKFNFNVLKHWIKLSWLPLYSNLSHLIWSLDVLIYTIITNSIIGVAYFSISSTIAAIIGNAGLISQSVYPKLLAMGSHKHINENFTYLMYFAIPLLGISIIFSKPALFALNPAYQDISLIVVIFSFRTFLYVITNTLYQILMGIENVDIEKTYTYKTLAKSRLFQIPTLLNIHHGLYIVSLTLILLITSSYKFNEVELVTLWVIIALLILVKKQTSFKFPYVSAGKFAFATLMFILVFFFTSDIIIEYQISIYDFLPKLILELAICLATYFFITFLIDKKTRILFKSIFGELISK